MFIPFISDVRVKSDAGIGTGGPQSFDGDDSHRLLSSNIASSNNPVISSPNPVNPTGHTRNSSTGDSRENKFQDIHDKSRDRLTPPSSPHVGTGTHFFAGTIGGSAASPPISLSKDRYNLFYFFASVRYHALIIFYASLKLELMF